MLDKVQKLQNLYMNGTVIFTLPQAIENSRQFFLPSPPPFPSFALAPTYCKGYYFSSPQSSTVIKSKMAATKISNTNKISPTQNTPALQANSEPFCLLRNRTASNYCKIWSIFKEELLNIFFCLTINYKELFLCKERVILKDAQIRKNLTLNWKTNNSRF